MLDDDGNFTDWTGNWTFGTGTFTLNNGLTLAGDITATGGNVDVDLDDNEASALSFDAAGKAGIINIVTTDDSEGVTMSGTLGVTGATTLTGGAVIADGQTLTFDESAVDPDDADIQLSAADGVFKIAAANGANNEDLTIDLDATANTATIGSSTGVTAVSLGSLNLATTGKITGKVDVVADADGRAITKDTETLGTMHLATGAGTWVLPAMAAADGTGHTVCLYSTGANAVVLDPHDDDKIRHNGTLLAAGFTITSASAAGNFVCVVLTDFATDVAHWTTMGMSGTWTAQAE
jgi:hypothetical protein